MSGLRFAMLGLISRRPMTGYEIAKEFSGVLGALWEARHSQIYPELKKLTQEGLLCYETAISGEVLEKKVYSITQAGKYVFMDWLLSDEEEYRPARDNLRVRLFFCEHMTHDQLHALLEREMGRHNTRLSWLAAKLDEKYGQQAPMENLPELGDYMLLQGAIFRERAYVDWLSRCLLHLGDIARGGTGVVDAGSGKSE